jgi:hypothetical protein
MYGSHAGYAQGSLNSSVLSEGESALLGLSNHAQDMSTYDSDMYTKSGKLRKVPLKDSSKSGGPGKGRGRKGDVTQEAGDYGGFNEGEEDDLVFSQAGEELQGTECVPRLSDNRSRILCVLYGTTTVYCLRNLFGSGMLWLQLFSLINDLSSAF